MQVQDADKTRKVGKIQNIGSQFGKGKKVEVVELLDPKTS